VQISEQDFGSRELVELVIMKFHVLSKMPEILSTGNVFKLIWKHPNSRTTYFAKILIMMGIFFRYCYGEEENKDSGISVITLNLNNV